MKDKNKFILLRIFMIIMGILILVVVILLSLSIGTKLNEDMYMLSEGNEFCGNYNMSYVVYLSGHKYCNNELELFKIKYADGFKFINKIPTKSETNNNETKHKESE